MRLVDFSIASTGEFDWLKNHIDSLGNNKPYIFDAVQLPNVCEPRKTDIGFFKNEGFYAVFCKQRIAYVGENELLRNLFKEKVLMFNRWDDLVKACLTFEEESMERDNRPSQPDSVEVNDEVTDWDEIRIPKKKDENNSISFKDLKSKMEKIVIGQDDALDTVCYQVTKFLKKKNPKRPLSLLAFGPPGIGKSETANNLASVLNELTDKEYQVVFTDLNTFTEAHTVSRLVGSPPGYVGYEDKPVFEAVADNPYTVFVFDELDKAHPEVLKTFMAILDAGKCASRKELPGGLREFDFKNCIIFFTSNFDLSGNNAEMPMRQKIGFSITEDIEDIQYNDDNVEIKYKNSEKAHEDEEQEDESSIVERIYQNTERARREFVKIGVLREIASRFQGFVEYKPLSMEAKTKILAKQIIETGFEYGLRIGYISKDIIQGIIDTVCSVDSLTVRSFKPVIEGHLVDAFTEIEPEDDCIYRIDGTIKKPQINLM